MQQTVVSIILPGMALIAVVLVVLRLLVYLSGAKLSLANLRRLHRDEVGSVQSLGFVLTLPFFLMLVMGIVQISQVMIAKIMIEYSAIAAARCASVYIPSHVSQLEGQNRIGASPLRLVTTEEEDWLYENDQAQEILDAEIGKFYAVDTDTPTTKVDKIRQAAVMALLPIAPSREVNTVTTRTDPEGDPASFDVAVKAYASLTDSGGSDLESKLLQRLQNKYTYAMANTDVKIHIFHKYEEPLLGIPEDECVWFPWYPALHPEWGQSYPGKVVDGKYITENPEFQADVDEFQPNEIGWQDTIKVTVHHELALLPGPGRMLARLMQSRTIESGTRDRIGREGEDEGEYTWPIEATVTISNEGQKPIVRYEYDNSY